MRFSPFPKIASEELGITPRRLAAAKRALERERKQAGMFVEELGPRDTPEERIARHDAAFVADWQRRRDKQAKSWREARRWLYSLPEQQKRAILDVWQRGVYTATPQYLLSLIRSHVEERHSVTLEKRIQTEFAKEKEQQQCSEIVDGQLSLF